MSSKGRSPRTRSPLHRRDAAEEALLVAPHAPEYGAKAAYLIEEMAGSRPWWHVLFFEWFSPVMALGNTRHLQTHDLFPLSDAHGSAAIAPRLAGVWAEEKVRRGKHASLLWALLRAFGLRSATLLGLKLLLDMLAVLLPPLLIEGIVKYVEDASASAMRGLFYALVVTVSGVLVAIVRRQFDYLAAQLALFVQSSVSTAVFQHTLVVSPSTLQRMASDDVVALATTDSTRLQQGLLTLLDVVGATIQIVVGGRLLHNYVGHAIWAGLATVIIGLSCSMFVEKMARQYKLPVMKATDERIRLSQELLSGIKALKLLTWERGVTERIMELRDGELRGLKNLLMAQGTVTVLAVLVPTLVISVTLLVYGISLDGPIQVTTMLPALMLLMLLLREPLSLLPTRVVIVGEAYRSLSRIRAFLVDTIRVMAHKPHPVDGVRVTVKNADFKWDTTSHKTELDLLLEAQGILENPVEGPVLHHINFYASPRELHAVVGARESGKSSFLAGIIGLVRCSAGEIAVHGSVAYVNREPFLLNGTIRENICFGQPYDAHRYVLALRASCLKYDWSTLARGDHTVVSNERGAGLTLSQRIRVALARSVYQNADVYVFDDILSTMDGPVAKKVFKTCMQTALEDKIVIMATQSLKFVKRATNVVVLARGTIVEAGDFTSLMANKKWGLLAEIVQGKSSEPSKAGETEVCEAESSDEAENDSDGEDTARGNTAPELNLADFAPVVGESGAAQPPVDEDVGDENVRTAVALWFFRALGEKGYILVGVLTTLFLTASIFEYCANSAAGHVGASSTGREEYIASSVLLVMMTAASMTALNLASIHAGQHIHRSLIERLSRAPMAFYDATPTNRVLARVAKDLAIVDAGLTSTSSRFLTTSTQLLVTIGVLMALSPWLVLILAPVSLGFYQLEEWFGMPTRDIERIYTATSPPIQSCVGEVLRGMTAIRIYKADRLFSRQFHDRLDTNHQAFMFTICAKSWLGIRVDALYAALVSCVSLAAVHVHTSTETFAAHQATKVGVALILAFGTSPILFQFISACNETRFMLLAGGRIKAHSKMPIEAPLESAVLLGPSQDWPHAASIVFDNVSLRYRQGLPRILRGVSFTVNGGSSIAIIGNPGSGKKSIFAALARLVESATGTISIDGVDISKIGLHDLRSKLAVLSPDPTFFAGTIRSNLDAMHRFSDEELWNVIRKVQLQGAVLSLDEIVTDRGSNYSDSERQQLDIARAILRRPKVVMIDEGDCVLASTPATDVIDQCIQQAFAGVTRLTITQRTAIATAADHVLVMVNGQIVECGTPKELQKSSQSVFRSVLDHWKRRERGDRKKM